MPFKCLTFGVVVVSFLQIRFLFLSLHFAYTRQTDLLALQLNVWQLYILQEVDSCREFLKLMLQMFSLSHGL